MILQEKATSVSSYYSYKPYHGMMYELDITPDWLMTWHTDSQAIEFIPEHSEDAEQLVALNLIYTSYFVSSLRPELLRVFEERFRRVAAHFPEIKGDIKIGVTNSYRGLALTEYRGKTLSRKLSFPHIARKGVPSCFVIGHELMHISHAQLRNFPGSERATDIFTLARLPSELIDSAPVYLRVPEQIRRNWSDSMIWPAISSLAHELAIEAVSIRGAFPRYIARWESMFESEIRKRGYLQTLLMETHWLKSERSSNGLAALSSPSSRLSISTISE